MWETLTKQTRGSSVQFEYAEATTEPFYLLVMVLFMFYTCNERV